MPLDRGVKAEGVDRLVVALSLDSKSLRRIRHAAIRMRDNVLDFGLLIWRSVVLVVESVGSLEL
jgi:hypothetical protein